MANDVVYFWRDPLAGLTDQSMPATAQKRFPAAGHLFYDREADVTDVAGLTRRCSGGQGTSRDSAGAGQTRDRLKLSRSARNRSTPRHAGVASTCRITAPQPRQRPTGPSTFTVGMPPPTRAITAKDGLPVGFDSR